MHRHSRGKLSLSCGACLLGFMLASCVHPGISQSANNQPPTEPSANARANGTDLAQRVQKLTEAMARTQAQLQQSQQELEHMRGELADLLHELQPDAAVSPPAQPSGGQNASSLSAAVAELRERQDVVESQLATHEQEKVETASRYPLRLHGLVLFNAFVNTGGVDQPVTPAIAAGGPGTTGASMSQTILGFDASGPRLFGAQSYADLDVDFGAGSTYAGSLLRLRTAHAGLRWTNTDAWFALDRPLLSPLVPSSLTAVSLPALSWSGNLWTWNPQVGVTRNINLNSASNLRLQTALINVGNAPYTVAGTTSQLPPPVSYAEQSRWPGVESRIALLAPDRDDQGNQLGVGAWFAPHHVGSYQYDAWAASIDGRLHLPGHIELSGDIYRGLALGGLGGGAYKDFAYREDQGGNYYFRPLDGLGGWAQLKEKVNDRLEFNAAFGTDQVVAHQFRPYTSGTTIAQNLVANRTYTGNVIFRPSAYLLFSFEYRHLESAPAIGSAADSNVLGLAAGYSF